MLEEKFKMIKKKKSIKKAALHPEKHVTEPKAPSPALEIS